MRITRSSARLLFGIALILAAAPPRAGRAEDALDAPATKGPAITFENTDMDLGAVQEGTNREFEYVFQNTGDAELIIESVRTPCPCTVLKLEKDHLAPGEKGRLSVTFLSQGRPGDSNRYITFSSNAVDRPKMNVTFSIHVRAEIEIVPKRVSFGRIVSEDGATTQVLIENQMDPPFEISKVRVINASGVLARIVSQERTKPNAAVLGQSDAPMSRAVIEIKVLPDQPLGRFSGNLEIQTGAPHKRKILVPFTGKITGDLVHDPLIVRFGVVHPGEIGRTEITISSLAGREFSIVEVDTGDLPITWEVKDGADASAKTQQTRKTQKTLTLSITPASDRKVYRGYLEIKTDHPRQKAIRVAVTAVVRAKK